MIKTRSRAIALAFLGLILPGLHKFYLRQRSWGIAYLLLYPTHIPQVASVLEGVWYVWLGSEQFQQRFNPAIARLQANSNAPLQSVEDMQAAVQLNLTLDVNRATPQDWKRLPQLSSEQGELLFALNQSGVQFNSIEDLAAALGLPPDHLQPLAPILRFYYYGTDEQTPGTMAGSDDQDAPMIASTPLVLNPNQASLAELLTIPDLSVAIAQHIIQYRRTRPYTDLVDFKQRLSLSSDMTTHLMYYLRF